MIGTSETRREIAISREQRTLWDIIENMYLLVGAGDGIKLLKSGGGGLTSSLSLSDSLSDEEEDDELPELLLSL